MASDNACVLNEFHLRTNNILSSNSLETKVSHGVMKFPYLPINDIVDIRKLCLHVLQGLQLL